MRPSARSSARDGAWDCDAAASRSRSLIEAGTPLTALWSAGTQCAGAIALLQRHHN
jgi:hypothetical protein